LKNRFLKVKLLTPLPYAIGNAAEEIFFALLKAQYLDRRIFLSLPHNLPLINGYKICNSALLLLESSHLFLAPRVTQFVFRLLLTFVFFPTRTASRLLFKLFRKRLFECWNFPRLGISRLYLPDWSSELSKKTEREEVFWKNCFEKYTPPTLPTQIDESCRARLSQMGIKPGDWFVCLHVRESGFRNDPERRTYRNADIANVTGGIRKITDRGGWVVRLGDPSMRRLPPMERVIDYALSRQKSETMDLFLIKTCRFYVGMLSGPWDIAELFMKKKLGINIYDCSVGFSYGVNDRVLLKHVFSKKEQRYLSIRELFSAGEDLMNINGIVSENYSIVENTKEEITQAVGDYLEILDGSTIKPGELQQESNQFWKKHMEKRLNNRNLMGGGTKTEQQNEYRRFRAKADLSNVFVDPTYLEKNWLQDSLNRANTGHPNSGQATNGTRSGADGKGSKGV
jgi:putative glycosyltransferase (TIGR04372 family)